MFSKKKKIFLAIVLIIVGVIVFFSLNKRGRKNDIIPPLSANVSEAEPDVDSLIQEVFLTDFFDFETSPNLENTVSIKKGKAFSGTHSSHQTNKDEFGVTYSRKFYDIENYSGLQEVIFTCKVFSDQNLVGPLAVLSVDDQDGKSIEWFGEPVSAEKNNWKEIKISFFIKKTSLKSENKLKLYIWNKTKIDFYVDDLKVELKGMVKNIILPSVTIPERNISNDFEIPQEGDNPELFSTEVFKSGSKSYRLDSKNAYSPSVVKRISEVIDSEFRLITLSSWVYPKSGDVDVVLVVSLKTPDGKEYSWHGRSTDKGKFPANEWTKHRAQFKLPFDKIKPEDVVSAYVWDKSGDDVYIDDFEVVFGETNVRGGGKVLLDMTALGDSGFTFPKNNAPFRKALLVKKEIGNKDLPQLIHEEKYSDGEINSFQPLVAGNFIKNDEGTQQVFSILKGKGFLYSFCSNDKKFSKVIETSAGFFPSWANQSTISVADFNGDGIDEILIERTNSDQAMIFSVNNGMKLCSVSPGNESNLTMMLKVKESSSLFKKGYTNITGDFDGDNKGEIISFNPLTGDLYKLIYNGNAFENKGQGIKSSDLNIGQKTGSFSISKFVPEGTKKDALIISVRKAGKNDIRVLMMNEANDKFVSLSDLFIPEKFISRNCKIMQGNFSQQGKNEFVIYNTDWRFDLKLAYVENHELIIKNDLDFAGFPTGRNPKFYESLRIITGKFTQGKYNEFITIACNCDDPGFDGNYCKTISKSEALPSSLQMYQLAP